VLTNDYLASLIRARDARYFLLGSGGGFGPVGQINAAASTIETNCTAVSSASVSSGTLYDCAGKSDAIADAG
jgi:hypothetical protein